jgi:dCMP deaminase
MNRNTINIPIQGDNARIGRDGLFMGVAELFAKRSTCLRAKVGAVAVRDNRIVATGYNGAPQGFPHCTEHTCNPDNPCEETIHAEANLIAFSARAGISLEGTTLYCTHAPCKNCSRLILQSGIAEIVYKNPYRASNLGLFWAGDKKIIVRKYE